ncbi:unnamed protein product [Owenia fusiformis]|uniref:Uncharacterized protein n=1 Tax=Owenia fusiformis TaxID=6347 RepID=A0A8J1XKF5_OWEFU|nr:unnamed protein product [Owenia fusiformis]
MTCTECRKSKTLIIVVVFIAMMLDLIMLTTLEPILPDILHSIDKEQGLYSVPNTTSPNTTTSEAAKGTEESRRRIEKSPQVGLILAIKPGTEILANIIVGFIVDRYGHKYPMVLGCLANFLATISFAFGYRLEMFLMARIVQAIGSSFSVVSGLALLACAFPKDSERARANGIAFGGLSLGMILGFPFGSTCYQFLGRKAPFFILAALMLFDGILRLLIVLPDTKKEEHSGSDLRKFPKLIKDPYILIALGSNFILNLALGVVITTGPAWMLDTLHAEQWNIGLILVIGAVLQLISQAVTGLIAVQIGRWTFCMSGLIVYALGMIAYPFCTHIWMVVGTEGLARIGYGAVLAVLSPLLAYLVDLRHSSAYGAVYGLYAASYNLGLVAGPVAGGILVKELSFEWLYWGTAVLVVLFSFLSLRFRTIEKSELVLKDKNGNAIDYGTFKDPAKVEQGNSEPEIIEPKHNRQRHLLLSQSSLPCSLSV